MLRQTSKIYITVTSSASGHQQAALIASGKLIETILSLGHLSGTLGGGAQNPPKIVATLFSSGLLNSIDSIGSF